MNDHVYIIAEAGVNHNGSIDLAKQLVDTAAKAGADAVKFQTFVADKLVNENATKADYQQKNTNVNETQYEMLKKLELDEEAHDILIDWCKKCEIQFLSTPFDQLSLVLLTQKYDLPYIKIPSGEINNAPFLLNIARTGKPVILSTGMATLGEVEDALKILAFGYINNNQFPSLKAVDNVYLSEMGQAALKEKVTLLHCTTEYPASFSDVNLKVIDTMRQAFALPVGYSDHTDGIAVSVAATALGACIIEKHFTIDKNLPGPDHNASLEPHELCEMVRSIRQIEKALGQANKIPVAAELKNRSVARKSLMAARDIAKGEVFTEENIDIKRPGSGITPMRYFEVLGTLAMRDYRKDELLQV